jgi:single-strand DNA-binding protein
MLNKVILQGNIGSTPNICLTQEGKEIATFSLATSVSWKDATGEWQSATDWHRIAVFRKSTIGWLKDVLKRGDAVYIEGKLTYHNWVDKFGQKRFSPHVVITNREGRVEYLRPSSHFQNTVSPNPLSNLNVQDKPQPDSLEEGCDSVQKDENEEAYLETSQENHQPLSH